MPTENVAHQLAETLMVADGTRIRRGCMVRAVISGCVDEVIDLAKTNLRR